MIAYHLDCDGVLKENSTLSLLATDANPNLPEIKLYGFLSVSNWGQRCYEALVSPTTLADYHSINSLQIDLQAEVIRKIYFPDKPSRFKSIFAVKELSDLKLWANILPINQSSAIFEIEYDPSVSTELDANFLMGGIDANPVELLSTLCKYWSGEMSDSPLPELLIPLPAIIRKRLSPGELIF